MIKRRGERIAAATLLAALVASLSLLAHPSGSASAASSNTPAAANLNVPASVFWGCANLTGDSSGDGGWVEVRLAVQQDAQIPAVTLQIGLAGPGETGPADTINSGGPTLIKVGSSAQTVRLAGFADAYEHVFIRLPGQPDLKTIPLPAHCRSDIHPTDFNLTSPQAQLNSKFTCDQSLATMSVRVDSTNDVDDIPAKVGIDQLNYTILLFNHDEDQLAGQKVDGLLVPFDSAQTKIVNVRETVTQTPTDYEVRVIAPDGDAVIAGVQSVSCASAALPGPSPSTRPTATTAPVSTAPETSSPVSTSAAPTKTPSKTTAPVQPTGGSSAPAMTTASRASAGPSATPTPSPQSFGGGGSTPGGGSAGSGFGGSGSGSGDATGSGSSGIGGVATAVPSKTTLAERAPAPAKPSPSAPVTTDVAQATVPAIHIGGGLFSGDAALVLLVFLAATGGLIGTTVVSARRR